MKVECVNPEGYKDKYCEELRQRGTHWFGDGRGVDIHSCHDQEMPCLVWLDGRIRDDKEGGKLVRVPVSKAVDSASVQMESK